jgi:hypothetical protein
MGSGRLGNEPNRNPCPEKCGIILFFTFFEGIRGLQASKAWMSMCCTKETHGYKKKSCFLSDFDEGSWDECSWSHCFVGV